MQISSVVQAAICHFIATIRFFNRVEVWFGRGSIIGGNEIWTKECNSIVCWIIWKVIDKASGIYYISSTISSWLLRFRSNLGRIRYEFSKYIYLWKNFPQMKWYFIEANYSVITKNELAAPHSYSRYSLEPSNHL